MIGYRPLVYVTSVAVLATAVLAMPGPAPGHASRAHAAGSGNAALTTCRSTMTGTNLQTPPPIPTWLLSPGPQRQPHYFTLNVHSYQEGGPNGTTLYCYVRSTDEPGYIEAPTIIVKANDTFTMHLVDAIHVPSPGPMPMPQATTVDGCGLLDVHDPLPKPNASGYQGWPRVVATSPPMDANDTNFHTHGWHVEPEIDNVFKSLATTSNACDYKFRVRNDQPPGSYWYHAHMHGQAGNQVGGGLAGTLIVLPADGTASASQKLADTVLLVKDYIAPPAPAPSATPNALLFKQARPGSLDARFLQTRYGQSGPVSGANPAPAQTFDPFNPAPFIAGHQFPASRKSYCDSANDAALQVNGIPIPSDPTSAGVPVYRQAARTQHRYRVLNTASNAYLDVAVLRNQQPVDFRVLARDGVEIDWQRIPATPPGQIAYVTRRNVMLPPSGRVDILIDASTTDTQTIVSVPGSATVSPHGFPLCTGYFGKLAPRAILKIPPASASILGGTNSVHASATLLAKTPGDVFAQIGPTAFKAITFTQYVDAGAFNPYVTLTGSSPEPIPTPVEHPFWLLSNASPLPPPPIRYHYLPQITVHAHSVELWTLINATGEAHAFHIHQLTFVSMQSGFEQSFSRVFLDSIALPSACAVKSATAQCDFADIAGPFPAVPLLKPSITKILIDFRRVDPGQFVYHCHMLGHEDAGMMGIVEVIP